MKKEIWKFRLEFGQSTFYVPRGAETLCVKNQRDYNFVWMLVDPSESKQEAKTFEVVGTGHSMNELNSTVNRHYIGSTMTSDHNFVWHVFEIKTILNQ